MFSVVQLGFLIDLCVYFLVTESYIRRIMAYCFMKNEITLHSDILQYSESSSYLCFSLPLSEPIFFPFLDVFLHRTNHRRSLVLGLGLALLLLSPSRVYRVKDILTNSAKEASSITFSTIVWA